jgi:hypothetical protein
VLRRTHWSVRPSAKRSRMNVFPSEVEGSLLPHRMAESTRLLIYAETTGFTGFEGWPGL